MLAYRLDVEPGLTARIALDAGAANGGRLLAASSGAPPNGSARYRALGVDRTAYSAVDHRSRTHQNIRPESQLER